MRRTVLVFVLLAGCGFTAGEASAPDGGEPPQPTIDAGSGGTDVARHCDVSDTSLRLCLDFEETSLTPVVRDGSSMHNDATALGLQSVVRETERAAQVTHGAVVNIPETPNLDISDQLTIEMWLRPESDATTSWPVSNDGQYALGLDGDQVYCAIGNVGVHASDRLVLGRWTHVACRYDGEKLRVFVDGSVSGCQSVSGPIPTTAVSGTYVGAGYTGSLDDLHLYARALSDATMCQLGGGGDCSTDCPD